jgi:hypothetical protein
MNIFALSENPVKAARQMIDKHIVKMPTESCQMLHTNALYFHYVSIYGVEPTLAELKKFHTHINSKLMKPAMLNHPSTIWARENPHNADWLMQHALALCEEYTHRYKKTHGAYARILQTWEDNFMGEGCWKKASPVSIAMADEYRLPEEKHTWDFVIRSYRHYYREGKWSFAYWLRRDNPDWFPVSFIVSKIRGE